MNAEKMLIEGLVGALKKESATEGVWKPQGTADEMISEVQDAKNKLDLGEKFLIGELVTPKKHTHKKGRGKPYIVVDSFERKLVVDDMTHPVYYVDLVLGVMLEGEFNLYQSHSVDYEYFDRHKVKKK